MEEEDDDEAMDGDDVMMEVQGGRCEVEDCGKLNPHGKKSPKNTDKYCCGRLAGRGQQDISDTGVRYGTIHPSSRLVRISDIRKKKCETDKMEKGEKKETPLINHQSSS
ncbi:hypothetical protein EMCG_05923 [[Emmonsia] crescens]|uniref:Uncharacterized protein n=1 Tax=[Emmonsia] crescens TaxID=73230 RepID=A0A0G2J7H2_9EURO|nr:hypothetical protein EMCG_05923 [Emmonsia crescens UAMH 3008]